MNLKYSKTFILKIKVVITCTKEETICCCHELVHEVTPRHGINDNIFQHTRVGVEGMVNGVLHLQFTAGISYGHHIILLQSLHVHDGLARSASHRHGEKLFVKIKL